MGQYGPMRPMNLGPESLSGTGQVGPKWVQCETGKWLSGAWILQPQIVMVSKALFVEIPH